MKFKFDKDCIEKKVEKILGYQLIYNGKTTDDVNHLVILEEFVGAINNEKCKLNYTSTNMKSGLRLVFGKFDIGLIAWTLLSKKSVYFYVNMEIYMGMSCCSTSPYCFKCDQHLLKNLYDALCVTICKTKSYKKLFERIIG